MSSLFCIRQRISRPERARWGIFYFGTVRRHAAGRYTQESILQVAGLGVIGIMLQGLLEMVQGPGTIVLGAVNESQVVVDGGGVGSIGKRDLEAGDCLGVTLRLVIEGAEAQGGGGQFGIELESALEIIAGALAAQGGVGQAAVEPALRRLLGQGHRDVESTDGLVVALQAIGTNAGIEMGPKIAWMQVDGPLERGGSVLETARTIRVSAHA